MAQPDLKPIFHITIPEDFLAQAETRALIALPQLPNLTHHLMPRYHRPVPTSLSLGVTRKIAAIPPISDLAVTKEVPAVYAPVPTRSATPTQRRRPALRFCFQCGTPVAPWRDACGTHDQRQGRGLPPPTHLAPLHNALPDLSEAMTALQPSVVLFPRFGK